ncbi:MAG: hypothetical protein FJW30_11035 [Acidobacteria bacterium]|nr:hypothetical protein [Acidobacteriota bacterium]
MHACLVLQQGSLDGFVDLAARFSPHIERPSEQTALLAVCGLERLFGGYTEIADRIAAEAAAEQLEISVAIASHPDTALLAALHIGGVTVIAPGAEVDVLGPLPVDILPASLDTLDTLTRWGVETLSDFAGLPPLGVIERLGEEGGRLQALVEGRGSRPLRIARPPEDYTAHTHLDEPLHTVEPLLFAVSGLIHGILKRLSSHGLAAGEIHATLAPHHEIRIGFPLPVEEPRTILKQVQLDLEARPPRRAIHSVTVALKPAPPRATQHGLFTPPAAEPEALQTLLARLRAILGGDSAGAPEILDTHRPDAWRLRTSTLFHGGLPGETKRAGTHTGFRYFRPALPAHVTTNREHRPQRLDAHAIRAAAGPWRSTGEWWTADAWARDEWDIGLDGGVMCRIYREHSTNTWFLEGIYD